MVIYYTHKFTGARGESHQLLDRVMADYCGYNLVASEELVIGEFGKPSLPGVEPFSISHSENTWVLFKGVSPFRNLEYSGTYPEYVKCADGDRLDACGIDVQYVRDCDVLKLAKRWYHPAEYAMVANESSASESECVNASVSEFFRIWARREALVKAIGNSIVTSDLPSTLDDEVEYEGCRWQIRDVEIPGLDGGYAAVCYPARNDSEIEMKEIEFDR